MKYLIAAAFLVVGSSGTLPCTDSAFAAQECCKVCKKGKACGNSCIAADKRCSQPKGCACNG